MKTNKTALVIIASALIIACHTTKKSSSTSAAPAPASVSTSGTNTSTATPPPGSFNVARSSNGVYPPGNEELTAIQAKFSKVTMEMLKEGHEIYTAGACIKCHEAKNIYKRPESEWMYIMDDMALRAHLTDGQKDAVYKYVLAIKATQPK